MNPTNYLVAFAWISISALSFSILSDFWLPMLFGAIGVALLVKLVR